MRRLQKKTYKNQRDFLVATKRSLFYVSSPIDQFILSERKAPFGSSLAVDHQNDVYLLFHQERLNSMTLQALTEYVSTFRSQNSSLDSLKNKMSDKQLAMFIKSRFIQSQTELLSYSQYLEDNYQSIIDSLPAPDPDPQPAPDLA